MGRYQAYPEYKSSECKWVDKIPSTWSVSPLKALVQIVNGSTPKSDVEDYWDGDVSWITPADMGKKNSPFIDYGARNITVKGYESCGTSRVPTGSIVLSSRAPIGTLAIAQNELCTNQGCKSLVVTKKVNNKFLYYSLHSSTKQLNILGRGTTFLELSSDELARFVIATPSICEQQAIANFLDHETAKIDTLIEQQQQLIQLLKEKRQAVISHSVTKGLNPNAPMKDSGVEWLGEVPAHWSTGRLAYQVELLVDGTHHSPESYPEGDYLYITAKNIKEHGFDFSDISYISKSAHQDIYSRCSVKKGDVLYIKDGATAGIATVNNLDNEFSLLSSVAVIRPRKNIFIPEFLKHHLNAAVFKNEMLNRLSGGAMTRFTIDGISRFNLLIPPVKEQRSIVSYIEEMSLKMDALIGRAEQAIQLMQERRTVLISAAVTGKIDVRNWQAPQQ